MKGRFLDPIIRQELGIALSNAVVGLVLAVVVGIAPSLLWLGAFAAVATFTLAALSDRRDVELWLSLGVAGLFALAFVTLWLTGQPVLGAVPLVVLGTSLGFGANRIVFGIVRPVPEPRRQRH